MCTSIVEIVEAKGATKHGNRWFSLSHAVVTYDHPQYALLDDAVLIDFVNQAEGPSARTAVELTLESAKALHAALAIAIAEADAEEGERAGRLQPAAA
jgi:hypothetical protein